MSVIDIFGLDEEWTGEQAAAAAQVRRFVDEEFLPRVREHQALGTFPEVLLPAIARLGILEAIAADSLDPVTYGLVLRELERGSSCLRSFVSVQGSLVIAAIKKFGSDEQKARWVGPLGSLEAIGCFGLTEPDFGSNPSGMRSRAERVAGGFRLTGQKCWITNGTLADVAVIWARLDDKIRGFLVETDRPGLEARPIKGKWSFRTSDTAELFLDGVEIPESGLLPGSRSIGSALQCLNEARYGIAWGVIGAARACLEEAVDYLGARVQFAGKPLTSHQLIQARLAWMGADITAMETLAKRLGELKASGKLEPHQVSLAKMYNCRKALEVARGCRELFGAAGIHSEHHVGRHMMDLETVVTYEGTEQIHSLVLGHHLTGVPAYE